MKKDAGFFISLILGIIGIVFGVVAAAATLTNHYEELRCYHFHEATGSNTRWEAPGNVYGDGVCWWERAPGVWVRGLP